MQNNLNNEKATHSQVANQNNQQFDISSNSTKAQQQRLLEALKKQPMTTIEIRRELDIIAPAPRIFELRHIYGYNIITHWKYEHTDCGKLHRVALYVLLGESYGAGNE